MKRIIEEIDFHILAIGLIVSLLFVAFSSTITFIPGSPPLLRTLACGIVPLLVFLEPTILTRVYDRRKGGRDVLKYFAVNTLLAIIFGLVCGLSLFAMLSRES